MLCQTIQTKKDKMVSELASNRMNKLTKNVKENLKINLPQEAPPIQRRQIKKEDHGKKDVVDYGCGEP